ncbi:MULTISPECIES: M67 family metallopeptidase [unclassified Leptolyngbya]|uniref:M67 family metallopeptidase n=1 Tax=unclassified Leptolyngbya TaxID=2650499 RepID=UPI0016830174|nr:MULTISPECIES: M67 family metallopeptidase [unclassified Leptolyngbya]MBD1913280.1 M67 family metallopeptidase [Leptolyngbya sp. FACHB-8]MBD2154369.1 M67 family metallopeptidase [Leptolyngbya sp. FACHB-16]
MTLHLSAAQFQQIRRHAEGTYPEECCGLLLGTLQPDLKTMVSEVWPVQNAWDASLVSEYGLPDPSTAPHSRGDRYWVDPKDLLKAQRYGREQQIDVVGIYHSHPDHPPKPSECDRQMAWPRYSYLILSVQKGDVCDFSSWTLDEQHQFQLDPLIIQDGIDIPEPFEIPLA